MAMLFCCHYIQMMWQAYYCQSPRNAYGRLRLAQPLLPHGVDHRACPWPGSLRLVAVFIFNMWARGRPYGCKDENPVRFNRQASRSDEQVSTERGRKTIAPSCGAGDRPSERRSVGRYHRLDRLDYLRMGSDWTASRRARLSLRFDA